MRPPPDRGPANPDPLADRRGHRALSNIAAIPFASFRAQTVPAEQSPPVRRKPLPANASPVAGRFSSSQHPSPTKRLAAGKRSLSEDSPAAALATKATLNPLPPLLSPAAPDFAVRDLDKFPRGTSPLASHPEQPPPSIASQLQPAPAIVAASATSKNAAPPSYDQEPGSHTEAPLSVSTRKGEGAMNSLHAHTPSIGVRYHEGVSTPIEENPPAIVNYAAKKASPGKKLTSFFSWKSGRSPSMDSPSTAFSDQSISPTASPLPAFSSTARALPPPLDVPKANASAQHTHFVPLGTPLLLPLPTPPVSSAHVTELEQELQELSAELAQSVRREMELEDELERMKAEKPPATGLETERRTSDYYSDSGAGSVRYALGDGEGRVEELEMMRRRAEQDKAQMKADMSQRLEQALRERRMLEDRLREVEGAVRSPSIGGSEKLRELESALDEARRRAQEERQSRESYESLIAGMRLEMEQFRNERDNLRDEVVPQLRAKLEGLENEVSSFQSLTYENSRMQQEIDGLKRDLETANSHGILSITEEGIAGAPLSPSLGGLSRSRSVATKKGGTNPRSRSNSVMTRPNSIREASGLSRTGSVKEHSYEPREVLAQRVKELQEQRDALHSTVKNLILRHYQMEKEHAKRTKSLEKERDRAMHASPKRSAFHNDARNLREEITILRRRADDALNQKWQCEKGLGGLKMDLDRAQQETASLRRLLQDREASSERPESRSGEQYLQPDIYLNKAYNELRTTHALSIASVKELDAHSSNTSEAHRTLELLKQSISGAEAERDLAISQAESYRQEARKLQKSELDHLSKEQSLASELYASAQRMDELANQVQRQIQANSQLRSKLAEAISRGEKEQRASTNRIAELQGQLRDLEDKLVVAQQHSEEVVASHEEEVREMQLAHNSQLQRAKSGLLSTGNTQPSSPLSPIFAMKSPRLDKTSSGSGMSMAAASRTGFLETKVKELEAALGNAEKEMEEVVGRMNMAQIEVAELQGERDEAMMRTKRLQAEIVEERAKVQELMDASFQYPDDY